MEKLVKLKELGPGDLFKAYVYNNVTRMTRYETFIVLNTEIYDIDFGLDDQKNRITCISLCDGKPYSFEKEDDVDINVENYSK